MSEKLFDDSVKTEVVEAVLALALDRVAVSTKDHLDTCSTALCDPGGIFPVLQSQRNVRVPPSMRTQGSNVGRIADPSPRLLVGHVAPRLFVPSGLREYPLRARSFAPKVAQVVDQAVGKLDRPKAIARLEIADLPTVDSECEAERPVLQIHLRPGSGEGFSDSRARKILK